MRQTLDPAALDRLGWTYVAKARLSYDPGYYRLAEQTGLCLDTHQPDSPEALLLRGHAMHNLHRFSEMEQLARKLVATRGQAFDYGLLGDAVLEQGRLDEAIEPYQKMVDLKPGLQAYSRVAHVRWLKGDLPGAIKLMRMATRAGSPRNRESVAWTESRLARLELQNGNMKAALASADAALELVPDYAPALLVRAHVLQNQGKAGNAIEDLTRAAEADPLPEYQWALADALRAAGRGDEALPVEARLMKRGAADDPRTFALYLATRGEQVETAVRLAREELTRRADGFTLDALAWSLAAAGRYAEADTLIRRALAGGTQDARLFYHAGVIAGHQGSRQDARRWLTSAGKIQQMLLPGEREQLARHLAAGGALSTLPGHEVQGSKVHQSPLPTSAR
ncbi:MAG: tetratricopeptide repeat protein [Gemmatimonadales bacterium]|nr:tetratricopeptide repeat protein [Gemmatimonadales bacterium]